jgi:hypothetical protein
MHPCPHYFFVFQYNLRHGTNKTCPICRDHLEKTEDCWEITDLPEIDEINDKLVRMASEGRISPNT